MPKENRKLISVDNIRHSEYYGLQETFDRLYAQSKNGEIFTNLMEIILSRENILLAYRNIKANTGSHTPGTDRQTIRDIGRLTPEEVVDKVRFIVAGSPHGYRPKPVRRKDIPKPYDPTKSRPLGIPCIWDRLIQQCIKQVMEPICEAKFSNNSFGFRPNRSVEHAIAKTYRLLNLSHLHYVVEFDIKGFFDNVNHSKLVRQIWSMGIRDKHLIYIIRCRAPTKHLVVSVIFRMIYCCGLRPIEARRLRRKDVNLFNGTVNILESKGHKDRIVVLSEDMLELCRNYGQCVETIYPDRKYFSPSPSVRGDGMYSMEWIIPTFRRFLQAAGISGYGEIQPRLYDLRHTFATHRLHQWVKEGKDVNACLAYLSEYMGHSNLESTAYYIHLLPTLYTDLPELHLDSSFEMEADLCD